jgi:hypothetical protein
MTPKKALLAEAIADAGKVSLDNGKMPGTTFPISAKRCQTGSKLVSVKGSVCASCYALRIENFRKNCATRWEANYLAAVTMIDLNPERWSDACAYQINITGTDYHRWFDSGDLQSVAMLRAIVQVAVKTPHVAHWLPTREARYVKDYLRQYGGFPSNLVVRVSSTMVDDPPRTGYSHTSTVHTHGTAHAGAGCEARTRDNKCGPCRACWDPTVENVSYPKH